MMLLISPKRRNENGMRWLRERRPLILGVRIGLCAFVGGGRGSLEEEEEGGMTVGRKRQVD